MSGCGTGKTLMAVHAVASCSPAPRHGPADLSHPRPTGADLSGVARRGTNAVLRAGGVLPADQRPEDIADDELPIPSTTSAEQLAHWLADTAGVRVVFATYQSAAVLVEAHRAFSAAAWTVMVCDGPTAPPGGAANRSPSCSTTTRSRPRTAFFHRHPKVHARGSSPSRSSARPRRNAVASMDNQDLYGRRVFSLPTRDAIQRGILSPFKVAVIAVTDSAVASALKDVRLISLAAGGKTAAPALTMWPPPSL